MAQNEITPLKDKSPEVKAALFDHIERHKWSVGFNSRIAKWTVREHLQVLGNIGEDEDLSTAIAKAITQHAIDTRRGCNHTDDECDCDPKQPNGLT